jgi:hypothetical protein
MFEKDILGCKWLRADYVENLNSLQCMNENESRADRRAYETELIDMESALRHVVHRRWNALPFSTNVLISKRRSKRRPDGLLVYAQKEIRLSFQADLFEEKIG